MGRAYVVGDLEVHGLIFDLLARRDQVGRANDVALHHGPGGWVRLAGSARCLRGLGWRPAAAGRGTAAGSPALQARDTAAINHHYDVGNDFYRLVLGPTMTNSCAYFPEPGTSPSTTPRSSRTS